MTLKLFVLLLGTALGFSQCSVSRKERETAQLQQRHSQQSQITHQLTQQWLRQDSIDSEEMIWIKPLGQVKLDSNGFSGAASTIYWRKRKQQMEVSRAVSHQKAVAVNREENSLKEKATTLRQHKMAWSSLWWLLLIIASLVLLARHLKNKW